MDNRVYYVRLYTNGGFVDRMVDSLDISKIKIPTDVYRVTFRESNKLKIISNGKTFSENQEMKRNNYYIGTPITKEDVKAGKVNPQSHVVSWLINGVEQVMLLAQDGNFYTMENNANAIILSPEDFVDGYYQGNNLNV